MRRQRLQIARHLCRPCELRNSLINPGSGNRHEQAWRGQCHETYTDATGFWGSSYAFEPPVATVACLSICVVCTWRCNSRMPMARRAFRSASQALWMDCANHGDRADPAPSPASGDAKSSGHGSRAVTRSGGVLRWSWRKTWGHSFECLGSEFPSPSTLSCVFRQRVLARMRVLQLRLCPSAEGEGSAFSLCMNWEPNGIAARR